MVETLFSTAAVHPRDRFDYWHEIACKTIVDHDSKPERREIFRAELQAGTLAKLGLVLFENSPMSVSRDARHTAHANTEELFFCRQSAGVVHVAQDGREVQLESGDMMLLDPRVPYAARFSAESRTLVIKVPRRLLEARVGPVGEMTARPVKPLTAENSLTSEFLARLPIFTGKLNPSTEEIVENQVLDLVAVSLAACIAGARPRISSARSLARMKLRAAIEARLTDPTLDPRTVARAAGISVRSIRQCRACRRGHICRALHSRKAACSLPTGARRSVAGTTHGQRDRTKLGVFGYDPFRPAIQGGLWCIA